MAEESFSEIASPLFSDAGLTQLKMIGCMFDEDMRLPWDWAWGTCIIHSPCNVEIKQHFRYGLLAGVEFGPDPFSQVFARHCPAMLNNEELERVISNIERGG